MTKSSSAPIRVHPAKAPGNGKKARTRLIHPVVIYPFRQPGDYADVEGLYELVAKLDSAKSIYARPITVMDRKTRAANEEQEPFVSFKKEKVARHSDLIEAWCVDTCQMWYTGLGAAADRGGAEDVYWLIPGDFNYGTAIGREVLGRLHDLPEIIIELDQDLCIGEIATDHCNSKQLIDTYGTFALLYNWFPTEAQEIRQLTERPRSEFFAVKHGFLKKLLHMRWYAFEQTVVMLLHAISMGCRVSRFFVGNISDLPQGKDSLNSAIQQVTRTEGVLKMLWRERNQSDPTWLTRYLVLETHSEQIRKTAITVLHNLLT